MQRDQVRFPACHSLQSTSSYWRKTWAACGRGFYIWLATILFNNIHIDQQFDRMFAERCSWDDLENSNCASVRFRKSHFSLSLFNLIQAKTWDPVHWSDDSIGRGGEQPSIKFPYYQIKNNNKTKPLWCNIAKRWGGNLKQWEELVSWESKVHDTWIPR